MRGYNGNILVNAMCVGTRPIQDKDLLLRRATAGLPVVYVGSKTGRDGIHGATMASAEFDDESESRSARRFRSAIPFTEKLLIEACLELMADGRCHRRHPGHGRGGPHLVFGRDGRARAASASSWNSTHVPQREDGHDGL